MSVTFRLAEHSTRPTVQIVEVLLNDQVVGVIYPDSKKNGIVLVSAHIAESETEIPGNFEGEAVRDSGESSFPPIPHISVSFKPRKYIVVGRRIQYLE